MPVYDLLAAVAAAGIGVGALWMLRRRGGVDRGGPRGELIVYIGLAGVAALVCAVMNILEVAGGGVTAAAVGNATNVFAAAMVWAAARRLNARRDIGAATAGAGSLLILAVTFVVPLDDATLLKTAAIALFSVLSAVEFRRRPLREAPGTGTIALAMALFAVFNAGRIVIAYGMGTESWVWNSFASASVTSIASAVVILAVSASAIRLGRALTDDPEPGTRAYGRSSLRRRSIELLDEHKTFVGLTLRIPDLDLIRTAHGAERAEAVMAALLSATREALPTAESGTVSRDAVVALLTPDVERTGIDRTIAEHFAALNPLSEKAGAPDIRVVYRGVSDRAQLDAFLAAATGRRSGRRQPAFGG